MLSRNTPYAASLVVLACLNLAGCDRLEFLRLSPAAKVNLAFPPSRDVREAADALKVMSDADAATAEAVASQYAARLELRALTCSVGIQVDRFASRENVAALPIRRDCLKAEDAKLLQYLGIAQVGALLERPPLRALKKLGSASITLDEGLPVVASLFASEANVAIVQRANFGLASMEIPSGTLIAEMRSLRSATFNLMLPSQGLSPNGRVVALAIRGAGVVFVDVETGERLWESEAISDLLAWLPGMKMALVRGGPTEELLLLDFESGALVPHPSKRRGVRWALPMPGSSSQTLLGSQANIWLVDHARDSSGILASNLRQWVVASGRGVTSKPPVLMRDGRSLFFVSTRDFVEFDLDAGRETLYETRNSVGGGFAKLDESRLLVSVIATDSLSVSPMVLDLRDSTLTPVDAGGEVQAVTEDLGGRGGYLRRAHTRLLLGDDVEVTGEPRDYDGYVRSAYLERQLAALTARDKAAAAAAAAAEAAAGGAGAGAATGSGVNRAFAELARDARIEAVGVYESSTGSHGPGRQRREAGMINVVVRRSSSPVVLVLSSYEPVIWQISLNAGARLKGVLVSSYHQSSVVGAGDVPIMQMGSLYAYEQASPEMQKLQQEVQRWTGRRIDGFQGKYSGTTFLVGGL